MSHARQTLREAIASLLASSPSTWSQVIESRIPSSRVIWPYLMVYAAQESAEKISVESPCIYLRRVEILVVGMLRLPGSGDTQTIEDKMDAMAEEIETKLTNTTLRAVSGVLQIESLSLTTTTMDVVVDEEQAPDHAEVQLSFDVAYVTTEGVAATIL